MDLDFVVPPMELPRVHRDPLLHLLDSTGPVSPSSPSSSGDYHQYLATRSTITAFLQSMVILLVGYVLTVLWSSSVRQSRRQRAWILTMISSAMMMIGSLPTLHHYLVHSRLDMSVHPVARSQLDFYVCTLFAAYLVLDLVVGWVEYRDHLNLLTGK